MRTVTVCHYWQDYNADDAYDGEIHVEVNESERTFDDIRDLIRGLNEAVFHVGERSWPPETSDGGEAIYYHCQWPEGFRTGDPQYRSGSIHFADDTPTRVLNAVIKHCGVYDANARWRSA